MRGRGHARAAATITEGDAANRCAAGMRRLAAHPFACVRRPVSGV